MYLNSNILLFFIFIILIIKYNFIVIL